MEQGGPDSTIQGDVTDPAAVVDLFEAVEGNLGPLETFVNNVGDLAPVHWADIDYETWN